MTTPLTPYTKDFSWIGTATLVGIVGLLAILISVVAVGGFGAAQASLAALMFIFAVSAVLFSVLEDRFEIGRSIATHEYNGITIHAETEVYFEEAVDQAGRKKFREVECKAIDKNGRVIARKSDTEQIGIDGMDDWLLGGGDLSDVRSTSHHVVAVAGEIHDVIDEGYASNWNDPEPKAALETEFGDTTGGRVNEPKKREWMMEIVYETWWGREALSINLNTD